MIFNKKNYWALLLTLSILGYSRAQPKHPDLRILSYNIHHANPPARPGEIDLAATARVINDNNPDLVALQEIDVHTQRSGTQIHEADSLARLTGLHAYFFKTIDFEGGEYGIAILSKYPIDAAKGLLMPSSSSHEEQRGLAMVTVSPKNGPPLVFASTHFGLSAKTRLLQSAFIKQYFAHIDKPVILCGDFNAIVASTEISNLDSLFGRSSEGKQDVFTIPADHPRKEIDFIMYSPKDRFEVVEHRPVQEKLASDHLPVLAVLHYQGQK